MNVKGNHDTGFEKDDQCVLCDTIFRIIRPYCRKKTALLTLRQKIPTLQYFSVRTIKELAVQHFITFSEWPLEVERWRFCLTKSIHRILISLRTINGIGHTNHQIRNINDD